jgi:hypothetical protein
LVHIASEGWKHHAWCKRCGVHVVEYYPDGYGANPQRVFYVRVPEQTL